jgi:deoxyribose-phosphate aldolase
MIALQHSIDAIALEERAARFTARSIKKEQKVAGLKLAISMMDLTTLEGKDTAGKVRQMCYKAQHLHDAYLDLPQVAAVCVYPTLVEVAKQALGNSGIHIAAVSTYFPSGQSTLALRLQETRMAIDSGADEIDMVISRGKYLQGEYNYINDEVAAVKEVCGNDAHLKVILETGELESYDQVRHASFIAMNAGADFIKTSTGKVSPAATLPVTLVMLQAIKDYYHETGRMVGMKPAGNISTAKVALQYLVMVEEVMGTVWMTPEWFRFGASRLANDVLMQLEKERVGVYQAGHYFSLD